LGKREPEELNEQNGSENPETDLDRVKRRKSKRACCLLGQLEALAKLLLNNGTEANNTLWDISSGRTDYTDPKKINGIFQDIRKAGDQLLEEVETFRKEEELEKGTLPFPYLDWTIQHYQEMAKDNKEYRG
jgi:hypothetical protein